MPRCSLKRLVLAILTMTALGWTVFLFYNHVFAMRQKSILRYQIEQELEKYVMGFVHAVIDDWLCVSIQAAVSLGHVCSHPLTYIAPTHTDTGVKIWYLRQTRRKRRRREGSRTMASTSSAVTVSL